MYPNIVTLLYIVDLGYTLYARYRKIPLNADVKVYLLKSCRILYNEGTNLIYNKNNIYIYYAENICNYNNDCIIIYINL